VAEKVCVLREANPPSHPEGNQGKTDMVIERNEQGSPKAVITEIRGWNPSFAAILMPCQRELMLTFGRWRGRRQRFIRKPI